MTWLTVAAPAALLACTSTPNTSERREPAPVPSISVRDIRSENDRAEPSTAPTAQSSLTEAQVTRQQRRERLDLQIRTMPGWALHESAHYFILTCVEDADFIEELKKRAESIRRAIRRDFPHPDLDPVPIHTAPNVIRVLKDRNQFMAYGAPAGSSGYWTAVDGEIVLYDDKAGGGRRNTWATLNGMVFLEYLSSISGDAAAAPWFLYGHSDYYSGFAFVDGEHHPAPFEWRRPLVKANLKTAQIAPLDEFVRLTQSQYHGASPRWIDGRSCSAQGWSFIWFLREGHNSKLWSPAWEKILGAWWSAWRETSDVNAANERAFAGVDWTELQTAWEAFTREL